MPAPYRRLGRITKAHGTQGEVSVAPRDGLSFSGLEETDVWIVPPPEAGAAATRISEVRPGPKGWLVRLTGIDDAAAAHELAGRHLLARGEESDHATPRDAFVGMPVHDETRGFIGSVTEVIVTGANDVLICEGGPFGQVLVPVIADVMRGTVDGALRVALLEGLIDGDTE